LTNTGANNVALIGRASCRKECRSLWSATLGNNASGAISQTGAITKSSGGTTTLTQNTAASNIILDQANNMSGALTFAGTLGNVRDFSLTNSNASAALPTNLTSLTALRNLTLNFSNAAIALPALTLNSGG